VKPNKLIVRMQISQTLGLSLPKTHKSLVLQYTVHFLNFPSFECAFNVTLLPGRSSS